MVKKMRYFVASDTYVILESYLSSSYRVYTMGDRNTGEEYNVIPGYNYNLELIDWLHSTGYKEVVKEQELAKLILLIT